MSTTISFVVKDELADWLESRAEEEMKSVSSLCQDIALKEYLRQEPDKSEEEPAKTAETGKLPEADEKWWGEGYEIELPARRRADAVRTEFSDYVHDGDDARQKTVRLKLDTPEKVLKEVSRRK